MTDPLPSTPAPTTEPTCRPTHGAGLLSATITAGRRLGRFALVLDGDRLAPRYRDGDVLVIDAAAVPAAGDAVIVQTRAGYGCMVLNGDGDAMDSAGDYLPRGAFTVCGVVVDAVTEIRPASTGV